MAADISDRSLADFRSWAGPNARTTKNYRDVLNDPSIDAIGVFSPDRFHEEHAVAVLEAGKHLYLEKPMALSTEACDRIMNAWSRAGTKFMMGFNLRYHQVAVKAREIIQSGRLGDVKAIWVRHFVGAGGDFYYHDWHATREGIHSLLLQKASHDIDVIHWLADSYTARTAAFGDLDYFGGDKPDDLTCESCDIRNECREEQLPENPRRLCVFRRSVDIEDNQVMIMKLENGIKASYLQCHFTPEYLRNYLIIGTKARLEFNLERDEMWIIDRPVKTRDWPNPPPREPVRLAEAAGGHGGADPMITRGFLDLVIRGKETVSTPMAGRMSVATGCAAVESLRNGGVRDVPSLRLA